MVGSASDASKKQCTVITSRAHWHSLRLDFWEKNECQCQDILI
jgi:hypothetical protein